MEVSAITVIATLAGADRQLPHKAAVRSAISAEGRRSKDHRRDRQTVILAVSVLRAAAAAAVAEPAGQQQDEQQDDDDCEHVHLPGGTWVGSRMSSFTGWFCYGR